MGPIIFFGVIIVFTVVLPALILSIGNRSSAKAAAAPHSSTPPSDPLKVWVEDIHRPQPSVPDDVMNSPAVQAEIERRARAKALKFAFMLDT